MRFLGEMAHAYPEYAVVVRFRKSKNVKVTVVRTSIPAATARAEVTIACPPDVEVIGLKCETYTYHEETVTEYKVVNTVYARSGW